MVDTIIDELKPTDESRALSMVLQRFAEAEKFQQTQIPKWDRFYKQYRQYREKKKDPRDEDLSIPTAFTVIETLLPRIMAAIFSPKFIMKIAPREKNDIVNAKIVTELLKYQFEMMEAYKKFYLWIKQALIYGTSPLKVFWKFNARKRRVSEPQYFLGFKIGSKEVERTTISYDDPCIEPVDLYDFFVDPRATCIEDARYVIHRVWRDYDYLLKMQKEGKYKNIDSLQPGVQTNEISKPVRETVTGTSQGATESDKNKIELLEHWEDDRLIVVGNKLQIVRDTEDHNIFEHGEKPFVLIKDIEMPNELHGIGELEPIESSLNERNAIRNLILKNIKQIVSKTLLANKNADIDFNRLEDDNRSGGIIMTDDIQNSIKYLEVTDIIASIFHVDALILRDIQDATAMAEITTGSMPGRTETATAITQIQISAASRFTLKIMNVVLAVIKLIRLMISLNQQFLTKNRIVRIVGDEGEEYIEISGKDITGNYDLIPQVGIMEINKEIEKQQMLLLANNPLFTLPNVNIGELQRRILDKFEILDPDKIIRPMEELPPEGVLPGVAGRGVRAEKKGGVPSAKGVPGIPV